MKTMTITATDPAATLAQKRSGLDPERFAAMWNEQAPEHRERRPMAPARPCRTVQEFRNRLLAEGYGQGLAEVIISYRAKRLSLGDLTWDEMDALHAEALGLLNMGWPRTIVANHVGLSRRSLADLIG